MTVQRRPGINTPSCESARYTIGTTVRAGGGGALLDLANDAAGGHPGQRLTVGPNAGGVFHGHYWPVTAARYLKLDAYVSAGSAFTPADHAHVTVAVTDGLGAALPAALIPLGWDGIVPHPPATGSWRFAGMCHVQGWLDVAAMIVAGFSVAVPWRFTFTVVCTGSVWCELIQLEECSRFAVDDADPFGVLPGVIVPRAAIRDTDQMQRIGTTLEYAEDEVRCTYLARSIDETAGLYLEATGGAFAPMLYDEEQAGVALRWVVRPRALRGALQDGARFAWCVRYRATDEGEVQVNTGGSASPYIIALPTTAGVWTDSAVGDGYLSTLASEDTLWFEARTSDQLLIDAITIWKY